MHVSRSVHLALVFVSAACYLGSFADADDPLEARALHPAHPRTIRVAYAAGAPDRSPVDAFVRRDPFSGEPAVARPADRRAPDVADVAQADAVPDIDPNAAPALLAAAPGHADDPASEPLTVRATIAGRHPVAYVARGGELVIVRVGDTLGSRVVTDIDVHGLRLSDGTRIDLPNTYAPTPTPMRPAKSRIDVAIDGIARIRKALAARRDSARPSPGSSGSPRSPAVPTPGPLPTVDRRGLPVGVNPTPDALDPTAFPYPYPYAPILR